MNRVYKVIWSKAKHCYVVTSEIARSVTKSASSARSAGRKGAAVLAMAALLFTAGGYWVKRPMLLKSLSTNRTM